MARPRKHSANVTGHRTKDELDEKKRAEKVAGEFSPLSATPPAWLDREGKREYRRVMPLLSDLNITALDRSTVAMYCNSYSLFLQAQANVRENGVVMDTEYGVKRNPATTVMIDMQKETRAYASSLGMTLDSRTKLVTPEPKESYEDDKFAHYGGN